MSKVIGEIEGIQDDHQETLTFKGEEKNMIKVRQQFELLLKQMKFTVTKMNTANFDQVEPVIKKKIELMCQKLPNMGFFLSKKPPHNLYLFGKEDMDVQKANELIQQDFTLIEYLIPIPSEQMDKVQNSWTVITKNLMDIFVVPFNLTTHVQLVAFSLTEFTEAKRIINEILQNTTMSLEFPLPIMKHVQTHLKSVLEAQFSSQLLNVAIDDSKISISGSQLDSAEECLLTTLNSTYFFTVTVSVNAPFAQFFKTSSEKMFTKLKQSQIYYQLSNESCHVPNITSLKEFIKKTNSQETSKIEITFNTKRQESFVELVKTHPFLSHAKLGTFHDDAWQMFETAMKKNSQLLDLDISGLYFGVDSMFLLNCLLTLHPTLSVLNLSHLTDKEDYLIKILKAINENDKLVVVDLKGLSINSIQEADFIANSIEHHDAKTFETFPKSEQSLTFYFFSTCLENLQEWHSTCQRDLEPLSIPWNIFHFSDLVQPFDVDYRDTLFQLLKDTTIPNAFLTFLFETRNDIVLNTIGSWYTSVEYVYNFLSHVILTKTVRAFSLVCIHF